MIEGWFFDGKTSRRRAAELNCSAGGQWVLLVDGDTVLSVGFGQAVVSPRVGETTRMITFPGGQIFESEDNAAIDALLRHHRPGFDLMAFAEAIENNKRFIVATVLVVGIAIWGLLRYGLPAASKAAAYALPVSVTDSIGSRTMDFFDNGFLAPSELPPERREALSAQFESLLPQDRGGFNYTLVFRKGGERMGANAFALPDATVIFTDEIIALAQDDAELQGVMLHEIAHVVYRHGLQQIIRQSLMSSLIVWITGDVSTASSLIVIAPTVLLNADYSRGMEWEADTYAMDGMRDRNLPMSAFATMLAKLMDSRPQSAESPCEDCEAKEQPADWWRYFSSHPATRARIDRFMQVESEDY